MANAVRTIGSVTLVPASREVIQAHARRLSYLGCASKIRTALVNEFGNSPNLPSERVLKEIVHRRKHPRMVLSRGQVTAS